MMRHSVCISIFIATISLVLGHMGVLPASADFTTPIDLAPGSERNLEEVSKNSDLAILVFFYDTDGDGDVLSAGEELIRIDDFNAGVTDQVWKNLDGGATAEAKFAGFDQEFGYIDISGFHKLFDVTADGLLTGPTAMTPDMSMLPTFAWGNDPSGSGLLSSVQGDNPGDFDFDHMVTYHVLSKFTDPFMNRIPNNEMWITTPTNTYALGWEDTDPLNTSDRDYNDLVVEVSGVAPVPLPSTAVMLVAFLPAAWVAHRVRRKRRPGGNSI